MQETDMEQVTFRTQYSQTFWLFQLRERKPIPRKTYWLYSTSASWLANSRYFLLNMLTQRNAKSPWVPFLSFSDEIRSSYYWRSIIYRNFMRMSGNDTHNEASQCCYNEVSAYRKYWNWSWNCSTNRISGWTAVCLFIYLFLSWLKRDAKHLS